MDRDFKAEIIALFNEHRVMTIATRRRDNWPQATVVSYTSDGLLLYTIVGRNTQKYLNIVRDPRVSVAISGDCAEPLKYKALSLGGHVAIFESKAEIDRVRGIMSGRHPQYKEMLPPDPAQVAVLRLMPEVVSIIDYAKGFGHSDLVRVAKDSQVELIESYHHHWAGLQAA